MSSPTLHFLLLVFASFALAVPRPRLSDISKRALVPPLSDPFYTPPSGYQSTSPGTILRSRAVPDPIALIGTTDLTLKAAYQILYRSTDTLGNPEAAVTTLLIPPNANPTQYLSYQTAYDNTDPNCAPSYTLQQGSQNTSSTETIIILAALNRGWYVSVPDYEGPLAAFTSGPQAGQATLDNIRAVLASTPFSNISSTATTAMWGYSGGALATEWAAELQPTYAPSLKIAGAAAGGLTPNIGNVFGNVNKGPDAYLAPTGVLGLSKAYPNLSTWLTTHLVASSAATFKLPLSNCQGGYAAVFADQDIYGYFTEGAAALSDPVPASVIRWGGTMGVRSTPSIALYLYKAVGDEISHVADTDALVKKYCSSGAAIHYERNLLGDHETEAIVGVPGALAWLIGVLGGAAVAKGCSYDYVVGLELGSEDLALLGQVVYDLLVQELEDLL